MRVDDKVLNDLKKLYHRNENHVVGLVTNFVRVENIFNDEITETETETENVLIHLTDDKAINKGITVNIEQTSNVLVNSVIVVVDNSTV